MTIAAAIGTHIGAGAYARRGIAAESAERRTALRL
jgi:hypothetical protein